MGIEKNFKEHSQAGLKNPKLKDLKGMRFGKLRVVSYSHSKNGKAHWEVICDCGNRKIIRSDSLGRRSNSCGCVKSVGNNSKHLKTNSKVYRAWQGMLQRCFNPKKANYSNYGGRGIKVCARWKNSFENFMTDMGEPRSDQSLDRINNNGNYTPKNCRWATNKTQSNNRRSNRQIEFAGEALSVSEWSGKTGISSAVLHNRLRAGWSVERALTTPVRSRSKSSRDL